MFPQIRGRLCMLYRERFPQIGGTLKRAVGDYLGIYRVLGVSPN